MSPRPANRRIRLLLGFFVVLFAATLVRAVWLQGVRAQELGRLATSQHRQVVTIPARRGTIYDRTGVRLAIGEQATTVYADPTQVVDAAATARIVARTLGVDPNRIYRQLTDRSRRFVYLVRKADPARAAALARRKPLGIGFYGEERRIYPQRSVAAQVLGYAGVDNHGLAGLELSLDRVLSGRPGRETVVTDPFNRPIDIVSSTDERPGEDVFLTLDHTIQANAEAVLRAAVSRWRARGATAVVLDPHSGAVLAMANAPTFDANRFPQTWTPLQRNRAVEATYEPGSTFKLVTVAGALSDRLVSPWTAFTLPPTIHVADRTIGEAHDRGTETMTVAEILSHSSNVGTITLALRLGKDRLLNWISRFGFGRPTGIDFPSETAGIVPPGDRWSGSTIGNVPIGHGIAVTPIQMAAAYAAVANGGILVQPHLVHHVGGKRPRARRQRILARGVAAQLSTMLRDVVVQGTGAEASVPGYQVAGKTGTAAKPEPGGRGYSKTRYVASFVGFVPASSPRLVIAVAIDEPRGAIWGGVVAAPIFQEIARFALQYLEVSPDAARR